MIGAPLVVVAIFNVVVADAATSFGSSGGVRFSSRSFMADVLVLAQTPKAQYYTEGVTFCGDQNIETKMVQAAVGRQVVIRYP